MKRLMMLLGLTLFLPGAGQAQTNENKLPPTDYGAGYKIVIIHQHQKHTPGPEDDPFGNGPIKLDRTYPLIASPPTPDTQAFDTEMQRRAAQWWAAMDAPKDNSTAADPVTDYSLDCEPVGLPPPADSPSPDNARMLPGVISMACGTYVYPHGAGHGGGEYWGFNWIVSAHRDITASDVFAPNTSWRAALTAAANAIRPAAPSWGLQKLDFTDPSHWVLERGGLGLSYSYWQFAGYIDGGCGYFALIPWAKLAPYLRKDGIVPRADWSATAMPEN